MKLDKSGGVEKNYQPVVIKFLNQSNEGIATSKDIETNLKNSNLDRELPNGVLKTVTDTLIRNNIIKSVDDSFQLLDFDSFTSQEKAWITMYCDEKIKTSTVKQYVVLDNEKDLSNAQKIFLENLRKFTTKKDKIIIGFPGPGDKVDDDVEFIANAEIWWYTKDLPNASVPRFWNCYGIGEPLWGKNNGITLEINPPMKEATRRCKGAFVKDESGKIYLTHDGVLGGGNTPGGFYDVYPHEDKWIEANDGRSDLRDLILISDITSPNLAENLADYVKTVAKFKDGTLQSNIVSHYLLFRHKSEDNPYEDDPSGEVYHFPKIANYTKVVPGAKAIWYDRVNGNHYFWGFGTISKVNPREDEDFDAHFADFKFFEKEDDSLEREGKFLKKSTPNIEKLIRNNSGFNVQHSISEINEETFNEIIGSSKTSLNDSFEIGHKLFLIEMEQKEHKTPFTDFDHVDFIKDELEYKVTALEKSLSDLSIVKWDQWISEPEKICDAVRNAVAMKNSRNLIWSPPFNTEKGYFDELDDSSKKDLGKAFYDFFKKTNSIKSKFDSLISILEQINRKPEIRLLAYLMFLLDSKKYFPVHPTNFDKLLEFYGYEKIKENYWERYYAYLELAEKIKLYLLPKFPHEQLTSLKVQSYMWVIAGAVSKNYWMIRPGTDGADWENQRRLGIIGIHYHTIDLSKFSHPNNQLSKRKIQDEIQESKKISGEEITQAQLDSTFGQFEKFYSIRKKDKIVAIGNNSTLLGIGNVTDKYQFRTDTGEFCHTVPVEWYDVESRLISKQEMRRTVKKLSVKDYVDIMSKQSVIEDSKYQKFSDVLEKKKQLIFYGPPGTGKTYHSVLLAEQFTKNNSSMPQKMTFRSAIIKILKESEKPMHYTDITKEILDNGLVQTSGETPHYTVVKEMSKDIQNKGEHSIFIKTDRGTYKLNSDSQEYETKFDNTIQEKPLYIRSVTFHQSYSYEEFIEGIRPHTVGNQISYELEDGIFKQMVEDAKADPLNKYVLLIDEINRGNISKIFGELITLIEKDKRDNHTLQLAYSKENFNIPSNLYIIGTMNTADRSLVQIDAALRRRFAFCELMPKPELLTQSIEGMPLQELLITLNQRISKEGLREKQVGHSYFMGVNNLDDLHFVFIHEIVPLLQDYFFDDYKKLENDILSEDFVDSENMVIKEDWQENPNRFLEILKSAFP